jgi:hypothetical protein
MNKESADKLFGGKSHYLMPAAILVIPPFEGHRIFFKANDTIIGYSHSMSIATQVFNNTNSVFKGWFAVNNPLFAIESGEQLFKLLMVGKICLTAVEFKLVLALELFKVIQEFASELPGQNFNWDEEFLSAIHPFSDGG